MVGGAHAYALRRMGEHAGSERAASIVVQRRIEWSDTDASGAWHNSAAFRFLEVAETALLDRLGLLDDVYGRLPRVHIEADFAKALWHRDIVDISLTVAEVGRSSIAYDIEISNDGETCARARSVAVLLDRAGGTPVEWPTQYRRLLESAGPQPKERLTED
jgi:YbgC/YbaW family acyl-CoA thioester hydrolase